MHRYVFLLYEQPEGSDPDSLADVFKGRGGKRAHLAAKATGLGDCVGISWFQSEWGPIVDDVHERIEFIPPPEFQSPKQKAEAAAKAEAEAAAEPVKHIKSILISNKADVNEYKFVSKNNSTLIMEQQKSSVVVDYGQFTEEQIVSNDSKYNNYLREKINELFDLVYKPIIQKSSKGNIVIVHGAWHSGRLLKETAKYLRDDGWAVYTPTIRGNKPGDNRANIDLTQAIQSIDDYIVEHKLSDVIIVGHSYGGMVISGVVDILMENIKRLVYWNAFVPLNGEALVDMTPPLNNGLFEQLAKENDNAIILPFPIWREAFINHADLTLAKQSWNELNPQPYLTFTEKQDFKNFSELSTLNKPKSYINGLADTALPQSLPWHPRLSERLGLFRYIQHNHDHEILFTYPKNLAECIIKASRD